jgi:alpha-1,3-rhamnosyl/mannosyltransferase
VPLKDPKNYRGIRNFLIRRLTPGSVRRAWRIVVPTEVVRQEILQRFGVDERRVIAIPRGVDHQQFCPADSGARPPEVLRRLDIRGPYMLYVGAIEPRRNLEVVLRAMGRLRAGGVAEVTFVVAGSVRSNAYARALADLAASLGLTGSVVQTGYVDDADLVGLLRHARLVVAPSWGEGFNMPPLEAMACGTPVVCSDIDVHRELLAGSACFFDTTSDEQLAKVVDRVWSDPAERGRLREAGLERAPLFTWEKTACQMAAMYRSLADPSAA